MTQTIKMGSNYYWDSGTVYFNTSTSLKSYTINTFPQRGAYVQISDGKTTGVSSATITFGTTFPKVPTVIVSPYTTSTTVYDGLALEGFVVKDVTTTGFTLYNVRNDWSNNPNCYSWIAMCTN